MWGGSPSNCRGHQTLQPIPDPVTSQGLHIAWQQTLRTSVWKTLLRRVLSNPPRVYLPVKLKAVTKRYLYALDIDKAIDRVTQACHRCAALRQTPKACEEQSTSLPPEAVGVSFAADVIKRSRQLVLVLRECVTSFTATTLIEDERHLTLRDAIIRLCVQMRPLYGPPAIVRTDPAPGFKALTDDQLLKHHRITIDLVHAKNHNKNPMAERAVQELENELLWHDLLGGPVSHLTLAVATANLNARIRSRGLSSREMWTQRDQFSNHQIPLHDQGIIVQQNEQRIANHTHSEKAKAPISRRCPTNHIIVGDLVYLFSDCNKTRARDRYLVVEVTSSFCNIRKLSRLSTSKHILPCEDIWLLQSPIRSQTFDHQQSTVILTPHLTKPFQLSQYLPLLLHLSYQGLYRRLLLKRFLTSISLLTNMSPSKTLLLIQF